MIKWLKKNNFVKKELEIDKSYYSVYLKEKINSFAIVINWPIRKKLKIAIKA